jgi:hypothetical protein
MIEFDLSSSTVKTNPKNPIDNIEDCIQTERRLAVR